MSRLSLVAVAGALVGMACGVETGDGSAGTSGDIQLSKEALLTDNGLPAINGLNSHNGLNSFNGLNSHNGLNSFNGLSSINGLMTNDPGRQTIKYLVRCALPAGDSLSKADQTGKVHVFPGQIGLAPQWKTGACDTACQEAVSACVMAHVNATGRSVGLWLDAPMPAIGWGRHNSYPMQESAFFGNIFVSPPVAYYCNGDDWDRAPVLGRLGANWWDSPYTNPFGGNTLCSARCSKEADGYTNCAGYTRVVTVYRDFDYGRGYKIFNQANGLVMEATEWSKAVGAPINFYTSNPNGGSNQVFMFIRSNSDSITGMYRLQNKNSGLYLSMQNASTAANTRVVQDSLQYGRYEQLWRMIPVSGGTYVIQNVKSGLYLNSNGAAHLGAPVVQSGTGGYSTAQMWKLELI